MSGVWHIVFTFLPAQYLYFSVFQKHIPTPDNQQNFLVAANASEDLIPSQTRPVYFQMDHRRWSM